MPREGRQTPTSAFIIPYEQTKGEEAVKIYNKCGRKARPWQELLLYDIMAVDKDGLWIHSKFGYSLPRRNGKTEDVMMRLIYALMNGERALYTAHKTTTSHSTWEKVTQLLSKSGWVEGEDYKTTKQFGLETVTAIKGDGVLNFRTRTSKGGLGEGYDLLIIDEAQEYTVDQESALQYTVTDSQNPQTILLGTPPTAVSSGTVFESLRYSTLRGAEKFTGWAEWGKEHKMDVGPDCDMDALVDAWYETNPSLGHGLSERALWQESRANEIDYNIQRLGVWFRYNQKSEISREEWESLKVDEVPQFVGKLHVGIKYGHDSENVALSVAVRTTAGNIFVECIDCRTVRDGNSWILALLKKLDVAEIVIDGASGQRLLESDLKEEGFKKIKLPKVAELINANSLFEQNLHSIRHSNQPSLSQVVSNCEKRAIGSQGGFGFKSLLKGADISLMDSMILAFWSCSQGKSKKKQQASY